MQHDPRVGLRDADKAAEAIQDFIDGMDFAAFSHDLRTQWAVQHGFAILAEALNQLRRSSPEVAAEIPDLGEIVGFRNRLIHNYRRIDPERVWDHAVDDLPDLRLVVQSLLAELDPAAEAEQTGDTAEDSVDPFRPPTPFD